MEKYKILLFIYLCTIFAFLTPIINIYKSKEPKKNLDNWSEWNKYILFWILGIRMFTIGFLQLFLPPEMKDNYLFNKTLSFELANSNIAIGILGFIQLKYPEWRKATSTYGIIYLGLKSILHIIRLSTVTDNYTYETLLMFNDILSVIIIGTFQTLEGW